MGGHNEVEKFEKRNGIIGKQGTDVQSVIGNG